MSYSIGGALIKRMELTKSHGLTPASAKIQAVGAGVFAADTPVLLNIGSSVFIGIITDCREIFTDEDGQTLDITVADNRILLQDDDVFCRFNIVEIIEDDPSTPGIDRQKRFAHIYPDDWSSQTVTRTDSPHTAQEILQKVIISSSVHNGWGLSYTSAFNNPVLGVDANTGKKLGTFIQEICDEIGVQMRLEGASTIAFSVKGADMLPLPSPVNSKDISDGNARGPQPSRVRVVGDRNLYQDVPVTLEPSWQSFFEQFWFKPKWVQHIIEAFSLSTDPDDRADAEAKARSITLREYIDETGRTDLVDNQTWGEVSRMEIPAWIYIDDIVFKAYRVPLTGYSFNGVPITSLELRDQLLCAVESDAGGTFNYRSGEFYPDAKAYCAIRGQPVSLYDPKTHDGITAAQFAAMRTLWQPNNRFNIDTKNKCIIFEEAVFIDSAGAPLFIQPNLSQSGLTAEIKNLVVPNASAQISPAPVKAAICFEAEIFSKDYGSGLRNQSRYVSGLSYHNLLFNGAFSSELKYADNQGADQKAALVGNALLNGFQYIPSGGFTRVGSAGTSLNGAIDRITVRLYFESGGEDEGIQEHIEYSKERAPTHFESTLELQRRSAARDLFPAQKALRESARQLQLIGRLQKEKKRQSERGFENLDAFTTRLPGNRDCGATYAVATSEGTIPVGMPVFVDDQRFVDQDQKRFAGIITTANVPNTYGHKIPLASQGVVPVRIQGAIEIGDNVGADDGADFAKKDGKKFLGVCQADYSGSGTVLLPVRLGGGGSESTETPFQVVLIPGSDGADDKIGVISNSHLFNSEDKDTHEEDNSDWGLLNDDRTAGGFSVEQLNLGDKIWLELKLRQDDQGVETINVKHGPVGAALWDEYPDPIAINAEGPPFQEFYNQIIAEITDPEQDPRPGFVVEKGDGESAQKMQVTQLLFTNLMMTTAHTTEDADNPGLALLVAVPWNNPGTAANGSADVITDGDDIMTPWSLGGGGSTRPLDPWEPYAAPWTGSGDPPSDQPFKIQINPGAINNQFAGNLNGVFTIPQNTSQYFWIQAVLNSDTQAMISYQYEMGTSPPSSDYSDLPPSGGSSSWTPPVQLTAILFRITADSSGVDVSGAERYIKHSLRCIPVIVGIGCTTQQKVAVFSPVG